MIKWFQQWAFPLAAGLVLIIGIMVQVMAEMRPVQEGTLKIPLSKSIPEAYPGWKIRSLDLGPTEAVSERSHDLLRLDDFVNREYRHGDTAFSVYIAYWKPGKMPVRLVNQHTPDRCWTEAGWTCADREWEVELKVGDRDLQPGQWGIYELNDFRQYTYFWHLVGGKVHWYGGRRMNTRTSIRTVLSDLRKFGLNVHREQFFIRIVSPQPMDKLWEEPIFIEVLDSLAKLCLEKPEEEEALAVK